MKEELTEEEAKIHALADELKVDPDDAKMWIDNGDYLVLTDEEANEAVADYIKESLWIFDTTFIINECEIDHSLEDTLRTFQEGKREGANDAIRSLINDIDDFINSAIVVYGRGHYLADYDGYELEHGDYFIYRCQ